MARSVIDDLRIEVTALFFALPASAGYAVGGGMAALAHGIIDRPTDDIDLFADPRADVARPIDAADALATAVEANGWVVEWVRRFESYARLKVESSDGSVLIDVALDTTELPPTVTVLGPTLAAEDVAVRKLIALFDRAEARDFVDFFAFSQWHDRDALLQQALRRDAGLESGQLADRLLRITEVLEATALPATYQDRFEEIRRFYAAWRIELLA